MTVHRLEIPIPSPQRLAALVASQAPACWLDSALSGHPQANFSLVVLEPQRELVVSDYLDLPSKLAGLDAELARATDVEDDLPFAGGAVGFLSYPSRESEAVLPAARFWLTDSGIAIDHRRGKAWIFSRGMSRDWTSRDSGRAQERCEELRRRLESISESVPGGFFLRRLNSSLDRETYLRKVADIQERIRRGDCYQANFSQRFVAEGEFSPAELFLRLRAASPAPQMAFLNLGDSQILSASPEVLLQVEGRIASSYPIKGTRPRGRDAAEDLRLAKDLQNSPKDAAELLMIVDLVRNDLGRCCEIGSIRVPELKALESLPQVHHLYAAVQGKLLPGVGALEALLSLSPGGSITGAPKLKAMEILAELESSPRGIYTGSIGFAAFGGKACFNIAIRTAHLRGGVVEYSAGGGIVADSVPAAEYEESLHKAQGFFQALGCEPEGIDSASRFPGTALR